MHLLSQIQKDERRTTFPVSRSAHSDSARPDMIQGAAADRAGTSSFTAAQRRHNAATLSARGSACCPLKEPGLGCVVVCSLHPKYKRRRGGRQDASISARPSPRSTGALLSCMCECVRVCTHFGSAKELPRSHQKRLPPPRTRFTTQLMTSDLLDLTWMHSVCVPAGAHWHILSFFISQEVSEQKHLMRLYLRIDAVFKGALCSFFGEDI